jgi:hypothetical protein
MITLREARGQDFDAVFPLLQKLLSVKIDRERWKLLFVDRWGGSQDRYGYLLMDGGRVVGFLGCVFSKRLIGTQWHDFCNLTNWVVEGEYRANSLLLMEPVLELPDCTLTCLTANPTVQAILRKYGFAMFETGQTVVRRRRGLRFSSVRCSVLRDAVSVASALGGEQATIFSDHASLGNTHLLVESPHGGCQVVIGRRRFSEPILSYLYYVSHRSVFAAHAEAIVDRICKLLDISGLVVDWRELEGRVIRKATTPEVMQPRLFKSPHLGSGSMSLLYSELPILNA